MCIDKKSAAVIFASSLDYEYKQRKFMLDIQQNTYFYKNIVMLYFDVYICVSKYYYERYNRILYSKIIDTIIASIVAHFKNLNSENEEEHFKNFYNL